MAVVRTLAAPVRVELPRVSGSRFIADASPVADEATARAFIARVAEEFPDATHHCWAWRLEDGRTRAYDAGEPAGTAGEPILRRLVGADLHGVVIVVSRWFGGTKLGTGGLVRAYGESAATALSASTIIETRVCRPIAITFAYDWSGPIQGVLTAYALQPSSAEYGEDVRLVVQVPVETADAFIHDLRERTAGRVLVDAAAPT